MLQSPKPFMELNSYAFVEIFQDFPRIVEILH